MTQPAILCLIAAGLLCACSAPLPATEPCQSYCNTHAEGYEWASRAMLLDERVCGGYAKEFARGCRDAVTDYAKSVSPRKEDY